jgi:hypothetical protein
LRDLVDLGLLGGQALLQLDELRLELLELAQRRVV